MSKPQLIAGRRIRHQFEVEGTSEFVWYDGTVKNMNPETKLFMMVKMEYVITVGPRLSEYLCATSMLKVQISEFVQLSN